MKLIQQKNLKSILPFKGEFTAIQDIEYDDSGHINEIIIQPYELPSEAEYIGVNGISIEKIMKIKSILKSRLTKKMKIQFLSYGKDFCTLIMMIMDTLLLTDQILHLPSIPNYDEIPGIPEIPEQIEYEGKKEFL